MPKFSISSFKYTIQELEMVDNVAKASFTKEKWLFSGFWITQFPNLKGFFWHKIAIFSQIKQIRYIGPIYTQYLSC